MEDFLRIGVIASTHGIRGEVKVFPTTDDKERFLKLKEVILDTKKEQIKLTIENIKFFKNMVIVKFKEYNNINDIEKYKGMDLLISRENALPLEEDEYYIADLIGLKVITDKEELLGIIDDVIQTGANDVYVVRTDNGKEILLPYIDECVLNIDLDKGTVLVHIMEGLLD
jgi:16S rRNA processing protein RimM